MGAVPQEGAAFVFSTYFGVHTNPPDIQMYTVKITGHALNNEYVPSLQELGTNPFKNGKLAYAIGKNLQAADKLMRSLFGSIHTELFKHAVIENGVIKRVAGTEGNPEPEYKTPEDKEIFLKLRAKMMEEPLDLLVHKVDDKLMQEVDNWRPIMLVTLAPMFDPPEEVPVTEDPVPSMRIKRKAEITQIQTHPTDDGTAEENVLEESSEAHS